MKSTIKYALLISLLSSTALASPNQIANNNTYDQNRSIKNVEMKHVKSAKPLTNLVASHTKNFKAFVVQEIKINFEGIEQKESINNICAEYVGKYMTHEMLSELNARLMKDLIIQDYLVPQINVVEKGGVLHIDVKVASINNVVILGEGKDSKLMNEYADKILASKPAKVKYVRPLHQL